MKLSAAATLLVQCVPALSQTLFEQDSLLRKIDNKAIPSSTPLQHKFKSNANIHHAQRRLLSNAQGVLKNKFSPSSLQGHGQCDPRSVDPEVGMLSCGKGTSCRPSDASDFGGFCQSTSIGQRIIDRWSRVDAIEKGFFAASVTVDNYVVPQSRCDPNSADLGVLSCKEGEFCVHDDSSDLGGICVDTAGISRNLFTADDILPLCDPTSGSYSSYCDCSGVSNSTGSGSIICSWVDTYFNYYFPGCDGVMADGSLTYIFIERAMTSFIRCYAIKMPYHQEICLTRFYPIGENAADSCLFEINDQECSSCAITDVFFDFDCSTIDPRIVGSTPSHMFPIISECASGAINTTTCTLCLEGYLIPEAKYDVNVTVAAYGPVSCGAMAYAAAHNLIPDHTYCSSFAAVAQKECCELSNIYGTTNAPTPGSSDPIVPDGEESEPELDAGLPIGSVSGVVWSFILSTLPHVFFALF